MKIKSINIINRKYLFYENVNNWLQIKNISLSLLILVLIFLVYLIIFNIFLILFIILFVCLIIIIFLLATLIITWFFILNFMFSTFIRFLQVLYLLIRLSLVHCPIISIIDFRSLQGDSTGSTWCSWYSLLIYKFLNNTIKLLNFLLTGFNSTNLLFITCNEFAIAS